jgi:phosphopantothenoylcysteine decarboxylase / phosphopantothenate---cysteine ligase
MTLQGKKILLAVSGSIAAYKSAILCRLLIKEGCSVRVVMTESAADFITPLTLSTLSKNPVYSNISDESGWNNHVELGLWADAMVVAPSTAATISRMSNGLADNMVVACYLSARCPVYLAPAMDADMWIHGSTRRNIATLAGDGVRIIPVGFGELASGLEGDGRMAEPDEIISYLKIDFGRKRDLEGSHVLITAGPTYEPIDPVRFIGNRSSGKMGYALAECCRQRGANVTLISGPVHIAVTHPDIKLQKVQTADEMYAACLSEFSQADIIIFAAAVADYKPEIFSDKKIKKTDTDQNIRVISTTDIAASLGAIKKPKQIMVGFALETDNEKNNALIKLHKKNLDLIVLNSLNDSGAGFQHDTNKVSVITKSGRTKEFSLKPKAEVANDIIDEIVESKERL